MDIRDHNRRAWDREVETGNRWTQPVTPEEIARARAGDWQIGLTERKPVPADWLGDVRGRDVLCLASGGGQQGPILAAAGGRVTVLDRYPACEAALARRVPGDARVSERFEVYASGVELANGFGELTDAVEQRVRFEAEMAEKQRIYGERYPVDEDFLAALDFMPESSGVALGFDRLVMLSTGAQRIEAVLWAPVAE